MKALTVHQVAIANTAMTTPSTEENFGRSDPASLRLHRNIAAIVMAITAALISPRAVVLVRGRDPERGKTTAINPRITTPLMTARSIVYRPQGAIRQTLITHAMRPIGGAVHSSTTDSAATTNPMTAGRSGRG